MQRRSFLLGASAATLIAAPAIVRAERLMKIWVPKPSLVEVPIDLKTILSVSTAKHSSNVQNFYSTEANTATLRDIQKRLVFGARYGMSREKFAEVIKKNYPNLGWSFL